MLLFLLACGTPASPPPPTPPLAPVPTQAPEPEPPPPEPPAPRLPDGALVRDCGPVPEGMSCIPGGAFVRGIDPAWAGCTRTEEWEWPCAQENASPPETIWLQTFWMDQTEVTYAAYKACEARGDCPKAGPNYGDFNRPTQPITGISWYDAAAFCEAQGKQLPTEAQWEAAARGPEGDLNPWGNAPADCDKAVIKDGRGRSCGIKKKTQPDKGRVLVVKSRPAGRYGLYDMIGNAQEWVADWYVPSYAACGDACRGIDPRGPCDGAIPCGKKEYKVVKGGSWYWDHQHANGADRRWHWATNNPYHHFGFRCASGPPSPEAPSQ